MAAESGIERTAPKSELAAIFAEARRLGRRVHYLPPYRHDIMIEMADLTGLHPLKVREAASIELIRAVVALRNIKSEEEIAELDRAAAIGYEMHTTAMRMAVQPGMTEAAIAGALDGIASSRGSMVSFPSIVSMHGEVLHGFPLDGHARSHAPALGRRRCRIARALLLRPHAHHAHFGPLQPAPARCLRHCGGLPRFGAQSGAAPG